MTRSRWFRVIVCLLMVCCLIFHMSPIKAEALALEASLAIGLVGALILASAGVVYVPETTNQIQAIGTSLSNFMTQWGVANNKQSEVQDWFFGIQFYDPGDDGDEDDDDWVSPTNRKVRLARGILAGISAWCASIILGNIQIEEETGVAPNGYAYYNGTLLPVLSTNDAGPYRIIYKQNNEYYYYSGTFKDSYAGLNAGNVDLVFVTNSTEVWDNYCYIESPPNHEWIYYPSKSALNCNAGTYGGVKISELVWSNFDIYYESNGQLCIAGSEPSTVKTEPVLPATYVGDIPQQIQDGELEPGGIELPDINYDPLIQPGISLQDSTIGTLHKLSTGELSYENFLQQIKVDGGSLDPNPPLDDLTPDDSTDKWEPPTDPGKFALDLKDFFPFCIPFDLYDFFSCLNADPVAPVIEWQLPLPGGSTYPITLDLSVFDPVAKILRTMELLLFCVGLAFKTRDLIRG